MMKKWKISLFGLLFILLIFVVTACDNKKTTDSGNSGEGGGQGGNTQESDWGEWKVTKPATCSEEGVETRVDKNDSTKTETRKIDKLAHTPAAAVIKNNVEAGCMTDGSYDSVIYCSVCEAEISREHVVVTHDGHHYITEHTPATCQHAESSVYTCDKCHDTYTVVGAPKLQHELSGDIHETVEAVEGKSCEYKVITTDTCKLCGEPIVLATNVFEDHHYHAAVTKEATCKEAGVITYTCEHCNKTYTEPMARNLDAHVWGQGNLNEETGYTTYTCALCNETKATFNAKDKKEVQVTAADLTKVKEIELQNATIEMDKDAKSAFEGKENVKISADIVAKEDLQVDDTLKEQIGDNKVFDFTCSADGQAVSEFYGTVKVSVPYELKDGEDPNGIVIWYLDGEEIEKFEAVYANGFVTFETSHFSKYVVMRLTVEEICEMSGHNWEKIGEKESTCTEYGQVMYRCSRCGEFDNEILLLHDHDFDLDHVDEATYDAEGKTVYKCRNCETTKTEVLPKKPRPTQNIAQNFINSLLEDDYFVKVTGMDPYNVDMQLKITENGNIYVIMRAKEEDKEYINLIDLTNGLVYMVSSSDYAISSIGMNVNLNAIKKVAYQVTSFIPQEPTNTIIKKLADLVLTTTKTDTTIELTLDVDKVVTLYDNLLNKTIGQNIDIICGEGTSQLIPVLAPVILDCTVEQAEALLETFGITVDKVIDMASEVIGKEIDKTKVTAALTLYKDYKIIDLINMVMNKMNESKEADVMPVPQSNGETGPLTETGPLADGDTTTTPVLTTEKIVEYINQYMNAKIIDIVAASMGAPEGLTTAQIMEGLNLPKPADLKIMIQGIVQEFKITLNDKYQLKKIDVAINLPDELLAMMHAPEGFVMNPVVEIAHETRTQDILDVNQTIKTVKDYVSMFDVTLNNKDWVISAIDKALDPTGANELTYSFSKESYGYKVVSSTFEVDVYDWENMTPEQKENNTIPTTKLNAFYIVNIYTSGYSSYKYVDFNDAEIYKSMDFDADLYIYAKDGQIYSHGMSISIPSRMTYNKATKTYELKKYNYSENKATYEQITFAKYKEMTSSKYPEKADGFVFYKVTYVDGGYSYRYFYTGDRISFTLYNLTAEQRAATKTEARAATDTVVYKVYRYTDYYYVQVKVTEEGFEYVGIYPSYSYETVFANGLAAPYYYNYQDPVAITEDFTLGNFKVVFVKEQRTIDDCCKASVVKVSTDGGLTYPNEYEKRVYEHVGEHRVERTLDGCVTIITTTCPTCGRLISVDREYSHNMVTEIVKKAVGAEPGIMYRHCTRCEDETNYWTYFCHHNFVDGVCTECGFKYDGEIIPRVFAQYVHTEDDEYTYSVMVQGEIKELYSMYSIMYGVGYYDENNKFQFVERIGYTDIEAEYKTLVYENIKISYEVYYIQADKDDYEYFLEQHEEDDIEYIPVIVLVQNYAEGQNANMYFIELVD